MRLAAKQSPRFEARWRFILAQVRPAPPCKREHRVQLLWRDALSEKNID